MAYGECKIYSDGSHYIAIPKTERPQKPRRIRKEKEIVINEKNEVIDEFEEVPSTITLPSGHVLEQVEWEGKEWKPVMKKERTKGKRTSKKAEFERLYEESLSLKKRDRRDKIIAGLREIKNLFKKDDDLVSYVDVNLGRKERNLWARRIRVIRKANMHDFNYFCTFTYDGNKLAEEEFKKGLMNCFYHLANRKGWKYMGVWERSPVNKRLHFHGIFSIPEGTMPGRIDEVNDYSFKAHKRQITHVNSYFKDKFGRNDFESIACENRLGNALAYLMKYMEKSNEKFVFSRGLYQYFISDIMDDDVLSLFGVEDRKLILADDFKCFDEGTYMGTVSKETIKQMRKAN